MLALDISLENFQELKENILIKIQINEAIMTETNQYGVLYVIDISVENPPKQAFVRTS